MLVLLLLVALGFAAVALVRAWSGDSSGDPAATTGPDAAGETSSSGSSGAAEEATTEEPREPATTEPAIGETPGLPVACTPEEAELILTVPASVEAGAGLTVGVEVATDETRGCLVDLGSQGLRVVITSGEAEVWSTLQCPFTPERRELLLGPQASDSQAVSWSGRVSREGCPSDAAVAQPGSYRVQVSVSTAAEDGEAEETGASGDGVLTQEAAFTIVEAQAADGGGEEGDG